MDEITISGRKIKSTLDRLEKSIKNINNRISNIEALINTFINNSNGKNCIKLEGKDTDIRVVPHMCLHCCGLGSITNGVEVTPCEICGGTGKVWEVY